MRIKNNNLNNLRSDFQATTTLIAKIFRGSSCDARAWVLLAALNAPYSALGMLPNFWGYTHHLPSGVHGLHGANICCN